MDPTGINASEKQNDPRKCVLVGDTSENAVATTQQDERVRKRGSSVVADKFAFHHFISFSILRTLTLVFAQFHSRALVWVSREELKRHRDESVRIFWPSLIFGSD